MAHLTQDDALLRLLIALDLIALKCAFTDFDRERAVLCNVEVRDLCEDIAVRTVLLLNRLHILLQNAGVEQLAVLHRDERHQSLRRLDRIAFDLHFLQLRIFKHIVGQNNALGHLLERRIEIVEIARCIDRIAILHQPLLRHGIAHVHRECRACRRLGRLRRTAEIDLHNRLADLRRKVIGDLRLGGTLRCPRSGTLIRGCGNLR